MKRSRKVTAFVISLVILLLIGIVASIPLRRYARLRSLENNVVNIVFPANIETIAMRSGIGDSGGNGNYTTLRVVLAVKTDLNATELKETMENMGLHFTKHYKSSNNTPIFYITPCESSNFESPRAFSVVFDELVGINDYSGYCFVEFVE